ncbi:hypothetical protein LWI29_018212 [Acer saccharum]|uniref:Uncharacterized protein n=1 Tax=Acer saccharum TaxID=4024 RepID=A0AA39T864_ACESA|nr:hypothetical protein LWI29_018212 [Acer saccharum]
MFVDGSSNHHGSGAGIIIITPEGTLTQAALRFDFRATNNVAEYEALVTRLKIILNMGAEYVTVYIDSQLVVNQVNQDYQARDLEMIRYLKQVRTLMSRFIRCELIRISRDHNSQTDALAKLASTSDMKLPRTITVFRLPTPNLSEDQEIGVLIPDPVGESWMTPIMDYLHDGTLPEDKRTAKRTEQILQEVHSGSCGSHSAGKNLGHRITRQGYYWPTLFKESKAHSESCDRCQRTGPIPRLPAETLTPMSSPWPFARIEVDIIGPLPRGTADKRYAVVAIDYFTKWVEAEALKHITEANITNFIKHSIIFWFGVPHTLVADHGTQFDNHKLRKARKGCWVEKLPEVLWAIRTTLHSATGETPYSLTFGTEAVILTETNIPTRRVSAYTPSDNETELRACLEELEERRDLARIRTTHHQQQIAKYHDKRTRIRRFNPGDLVLKKILPSTKPTSSGSLGDKWEGPYIVDSVSMKGAYKLKREDGTPLKNLWNADHLKKYYP